jgi:hypothetical protein
MVHATATFEKDHQGFRVFPGHHVHLQETLRKMPRRLRLLHRRPAAYREVNGLLDCWIIGFEFKKRRISLKFIIAANCPIIYFQALDSSKFFSLILQKKQFFILYFT